MLTFYVILYSLAAVCFFLYAAGLDRVRINLLGAGVFFWSLVPLIKTLQML